MAANPPFTTGEIPSAAKWNTGAYVYDVSTSTVDVVSTVTETSVYSKSIGAGHLSNNRRLRLVLEGDTLINLGASTLTLRCKFGGTAWFGAVTPSLGTAAVRKNWTIELWLQNLGATNIQRAWGYASNSAPVAGSVAGIGDLGVAPSGWLVSGTAGGFAPFGSNGTTMAIDTTLAQTLDVTVQWSASSASLSFRKTSALLELL